MSYTLVLNGIRVADPDCSKLVRGLPISEWVRLLGEMGFERDVSILRHKKDPTFKIYLKVESERVSIGFGDETVSFAGDLPLKVVITRVLKEARLYYKGRTGVRQSLLSLFEAKRR